MRRWKEDFEAGTGFELFRTNVEKKKKLV